jgi:indole-3-glycerol phosphate synthase
MSDKLTEIMAWKHVEIAARMRPVSEAELGKANSLLAKPSSFTQALRRKDGGIGVIAEIKRRSPSAGEIKQIASAKEQAIRYQAAGADCLSVLTDEKYFGGTLADLEEVTAYFGTNPPAIPCLRKDFMIHPVQVLEARQAGASAILIIVRALDDETVRVLFAAAQAAGLEALFEVHNEPEIERALAHGAALIGVNNRDLAVFKTDLGLSERLIPMIPKSVLAVSESGIFSGADAARVKRVGARAVLVGEALMKAPEPKLLVDSMRSHV